MQSHHAIRPLRTALLRVATISLAILSGSVAAQSQMADPFDGITNAFKNLKNNNAAPPDPQATPPAPPTTSRSYYPEVGTGNTREKTDRMQGAYDSIYREGEAQCGPGCRAENGICVCDPGVVGQRPPDTGSSYSPYEGGRTTTGDVVGPSGQDGNMGLPEGN
jgi:hypothetical protein